MIVINLFGGACSGKSTIAAGLFYELKRKHCIVEFALEFAKDLVYSGTLSQTPQEFIFAEQYRRLQILEDKVDYVICDCPIILSYMYYLRNNDPTKRFNSQAFLDFVIKTHNTYKNFNVFLGRPDKFIGEGRVHTLEQSKEIDQAIIDLLNQFHVPYHMIQTNDETLNRILEFYPFET